MYCNQCGKPLPADAKFCHHCGSAIGIEQNKKPQEEPSKKSILPPRHERDIHAKSVNTKTPRQNKKLILMLLIAIAFIAIIAVIVNAIQSHQKVLAELPDPEYYYAHEPIDEIKKFDDVKRVILRSDEDLWNQAAGYVNLLKWSGKYPVTQFHEERYPSGDYIWEFKYNNEDEIKRPYYLQIEVNYYSKSESRDYYAVWISIHDMDAFELVQEEQYKEEDAFITIPDTDSSDETELNNSVTNDDAAVETPIVDSSSDFDDDEDDSYEVPEVSDIYDAKTPCGVCNRSGDCQTCSGDGYLMSSASDEEDRNCYSCSGSGNCRSCGGDGEL